MIVLQEALVRCTTTPPGVLATFLDPFLSSTRTNRSTNLGLLWSHPNFQGRSDPRFANLELGALRWALRRPGITDAVAAEVVAGAGRDVVRRYVSSRLDPHPAAVATLAKLTPDRYSLNALPPDCWAALPHLEGAHHEAAVRSTLWAAAYHDPRSDRWIAHALRHPDQLGDLVEHTAPGFLRTCLESFEQLAKTGVDVAAVHREQVAHRARQTNTSRDFAHAIAVTGDLRLLAHAPLDDLRHPDEASLRTVVSALLPEVIVDYGQMLWGVIVDDGGRVPDCERLTLATIERTYGSEVLRAVATGPRTHAVMDAAVTHVSRNWGTSRHRSPRALLAWLAYLDIPDGPARTLLELDERTQIECPDIVALIDGVETHSARDAFGAFPVRLLESAAVAVDDLADTLADADIVADEVGCRSLISLANGFTGTLDELLQVAATVAA